MKVFKSLALSAVALVGFVTYTGTVNADEVEYTIKPNDTLSAISQQFYHSEDFVNRIAEDNNIDNVDLIFSGLTLKINTEASPITQRQVVPQAPVAQAPVQQAPVAQAPVQQAPVAQAPVQQAPAKPAAPVQQATGSESEAKEWIAFKESGGSYNARNGKYIGRYQLTNSYLNGDYSPANQERVANSYVVSRYGSWIQAKQFWLSNGWY